MDPYRFTTIAHHDREFLGPVSAESADAILSHVRLAPRPHGRVQVLDVGCGKGAWLLRAMRRFLASGVGIEPNPSYVSWLRTTASREIEDGVLRIEAQNADRCVLQPNSFDLAICIGSTHAFGGYTQTLEQLPRMLVPRGWAIVGDGFWMQRPHPDYLAYFGEPESMMLPLEETLAAARTAGWRVAAHRVTTLEEFDDYEHAYESNMRRWLNARAEHPDHVAFRERIDAHAHAYATWGRGTFGFVTMVLQR